MSSNSQKQLSGGFQGLGEGGNGKLLFNECTVSVCKISSRTLLHNMVIPVNNPHCTQQFVKRVDLMLSALTTKIKSVRPRTRVGQPGLFPRH